ncbi:hypothetical protein HMPREF1572_00412 [Gardnerella vaginalis JCP7275]|nr:hypothetical protein HMPREF1572_00412 [Gardnerella vaginalis JCP7275]
MQLHTEQLIVYYINKKQGCAPEKHSHITQLKTLQRKIRNYKNLIHNDAVLKKHSNQNLWWGLLV